MPVLGVQRVGYPRGEDGAIQIGNYPPDEAEQWNGLLKQCERRLPESGEYCGMFLPEGNELQWLSVPQAITYGGTKFWVQGVRVKDGVACEFYSRGIGCVGRAWDVLFVDDEKKYKNLCPEIWAKDYFLKDRLVYYRIPDDKPVEYVNERWLSRGEDGELYVRDPRRAP